MPTEALISLLILLPVLITVLTVSALKTEAGGRVAFIREAAIVLGAFAVYFAVRGWTQGDVATAMANAAAIEEVQDNLGIFVEPALQEAVLDYGWLIAVVNWIYTWGHWPVIGALAIWLFRRNRGDYFLFRNAFLISGGIGLICFAVFPVAPPRLATTGMLDTLMAYSTSFHVLQPSALVNQYAAMPSLHFGWNLLVAIAVIRQFRRPLLHVLAGAMPFAMLASIVLTANHFILDAVAGGIVALIGLAIASRLPERSVVLARLSPLPLPRPRPRTAGGEGRRAGRRSGEV